MAKQTISVAIATYNEERNIARCLDAVKDWVDEIVIVENKSTDRTLEIVKRYTDKIIISDNEPMIHITKNKAIDACTKDWILQLDADEVVSPRLRDEIIETINRSPKENGFWIPRANYSLGRFLKKGGQYPDATIRLYRRGAGRLPCVSVHEQAKIEGDIGWLHHDLLHYSDPSFSRYLVRWNRYTTLDAQDLIEGKKKLAQPAFFQYFFWKPVVEFVKIYGRHRGYVDGFPGFVFALFSSLRFWAIYIKYWERSKQNQSAIDPNDWN